MKGGPVFFGNGDKMRAVRKLIAAAAPTDATVLITGETGTGKELVARALHAEQPRAASGPSSRSTARAIPRDLVESELFGHERGAFTGARRARKPAASRLADGGTLFLDEIGEMPLGRCRSSCCACCRSASSSASAATQDHRGRRPHHRRHQPRPRRRRSTAGRFREDLFYRLNVVPDRTCRRCASGRDDIAAAGRALPRASGPQVRAPVPELHPSVLLTSDCTSGRATSASSSNSS